MNCSFITRFLWCHFYQTTNPTTNQPASQPTTARHSHPFILFLISHSRLFIVSFFFLLAGAIFEQGTDEVQSAFKFAMLNHNLNVTARRFELQAYVDVINTADAFKLSRLSKYCDTVNSSKTHIHSQFYTKKYKKNLQKNTRRWWRKKKRSNGIANAAYRFHNWRCQTCFRMCVLKEFAENSERTKEKDLW